EQRTERRRGDIQTDNRLWRAQLPRRINRIKRGRQIARRQNKTRQQVTTIVMILSNNRARGAHLLQKSHAAARDFLARFAHLREQHQTRANRAERDHKQQREIVWKRQPAFGTQRHRDQISCQQSHRGPAEFAPTKKRTATRNRNDFGDNRHKRIARYASRERINGHQDEKDREQQCRIGRAPKIGGGHNQKPAHDAYRCRARVYRFLERQLLQAVRNQKLRNKPAAVIYRRHQPDQQTRPAQLRDKQRERQRRRNQRVHKTKNRAVDHA